MPEPTSHQGPNLTNAPAVQSQGDAQAGEDQGRFGPSGHRLGGLVILLVCLRPWTGGSTRSCPPRRWPLERRSPTGAR